MPKGSGGSSRRPARAVRDAVVADLYGLKKSNFLQEMFYDADPTFDPDYLAEHLNTYIAMGIEWETIECSVTSIRLRMCSLTLARAWNGTDG